MPTHPTHAPHVHTAAQATNETAYDMAASILVRLDSKLSIAVATTVNAMMGAAAAPRRPARGASKKRDDEEESEGEDAMDEDGSSAGFAAASRFSKKQVRQGARCGAAATERTA